MKFKYTQSREIELARKRDPYMVAHRIQLAKIYRAMRKSNPKTTRLLWRRIRQGCEDLKRLEFNMVEDALAKSGGLGLLFE